MAVLQRSINFFADGSHETQSPLSQILLAQRSGSLLASFLSRVSAALQEEHRKLPTADREGIPSFHNLHCLVRQPGDQSQPHPALHPTELVLVQLACFITSYEQRPRDPYPCADQNIIVGLCFGQLSGAAVSLARNLTELLPLAVEAVRLAFRAGIVTATIGNELEPRKISKESWSISVSRGSGLADGTNLDDTCKELGILERKRAFVTALSRKAVTIGGPPSTLNALIGHLERSSKSTSRSRPNRIQIYAPYHAPNLFSQASVAEVLDNLPSLKETFDATEWSDQRRTLIGGTTGEYYSASSRRDLLEKVIYNILAEPIYWEKVLLGCTSQATALGISKWIVRPFGPGPAAGGIAAMLENEANVEVKFDDSFGSSTSQPSSSKNIPLAIVGMAGRFPSAANHDELWKTLERGLDCHRVIPTDRFDPQTHLSSNARYGCFIDEPGLFDARFFNLSPREALQTDPGQRLALATAYEALEMSGYVPNRTPSTQLDRIGTFYGQTADEYKEQNMSQDVGTYFMPGSIRAFGPGRINFFFKFGGPAYSVDTACSSSLVAINMACNSIWSGECDTALAGGMNIATGSDNYEGLSAGHFLSETGGCKTFDDAADGYCRGEAVASIVLKRLDAAQADNDNILATVLSTATNYPAESISITHPHGPTQETLYRDVLSQAGIRPFDVDYVEMHGTGTQAGDAVEMSSISNVFAPEVPARPAGLPLFVGATKANMGHGEAVSGVTALIKTLLVLREQRLPPHVGIKNTINHTFPDLEKRGIEIPRKVTEFPSPQPQRRRRALVNNFSAAGGNTALVLEGPLVSSRNAIDDPRQDHVVNVTAKTATALRNNTQNLINYLDNNNETRLTDLSYTSTARRIQHPLRTSIVASTTAQLKERLNSSLEKEDFKAPRCPSIVFAFTGQGALYSSVGKDLYRSSNQFRGDLIRFDQTSQNQGFPSFLSVVDGRAGDVHTLKPVQTQLAITAIQMALCRLWTSWGIKADVVIGHSLGEYAALYASEVLTASDVLYLVGRRAIILETSCTMQTHAMLAVHATSEATKQTLGSLFRSLEIACINGPEDIVLSGSVQSIEEADQKLKDNSLRSTVLNIPFAFHSSQVDPILDPFEKSAAAVTFMKPRVPVASPLLRSVIRDENIIDASYLRRHAREPVDFCGALQTLEAENLVNPESVWLEVGPHPLCLGMIKATLGGKSRGVATLRNNERPWTTACKTLSVLCTQGIDVTWKEYHRDFEGCQRLLNIPTYAFDEKNYWIEYKNDWLLTKGAIQESPPPAMESGPATTTVQKLISQETNKDGKVIAVFETDLASPAMHTAITGHIINGIGLCPASVYADIALTVADYIRKEHNIQVPASGINVLNMEIPKPITISKSRPDNPQLVRITGCADLTKGLVEIEYSKYSAATKKSDPGAKCLVEFGDTQNWLDQWARTAYLVRKRIEALENGVQQGTTQKLYRGMAYKLFAGLVQYESNYQGMQEVLLDSEELESTALLKLYDGNDGGKFFCSPFWIDSFAHLAGFVMNANDAIDSSKIVYISHGWGSMRFAENIDPQKSYRVHVKMQALGKSMVAGDMSIFQGETMVGMIGDLKFQQVPRQLLDSMLPPVASSPTRPRAPIRSLSPSKSATKPQSIPKKFTPSPRANSSDKVFAIIAEEIGMPASELSNDSEFSELGVDSLMSLTILSKLRETLQMDIPQSTFEDCPTVGNLRSHLQKLNGEDDDTDSTTTDTPPSSGVETPESIEGSEPVVAGDTVSILRSTVAEQIGIEVEELLAADDLSAFGVDSLMSLSILGALREKTGLTIPRDTISENTSLEDLEKALVPSSEAPPPKEAPAKPQAKPSPKPKIALSFLLQGNQKTATKNIFLFPDGSGSATSYEKLPEISSSVCVFGLNSPYLRATEDYTTSIEEISAIWIKEIRQRQPQGPYILAGWSAGGYYAYEATKQLIEAGERIESLILIDSPSRNVFEAIPMDLLDYLSKNGLMGADPKKATPAWLVDHFSSTIKAVEKYKPTPIDPSKVPKTYIIWASGGVVEDLDSVKSQLDLSIKVTKFMLQRKDDLGPQGWEKLLSNEKIEVANTPGTHFTLVQPPNCKILSGLIGDAVASDSSKRTGNWKGA